MNDTLSGLFTLAEKLENGGRLCIMTGSHEDAITLRAEWRLDKSYKFEKIFTKFELDRANLDLAEMFVDEANHSLRIRLEEDTYYYK